MFALLLVVTVSTAGEPSEVVLSPEAAAQMAEEAHAEFMGELQAMSEDVRSIDVELLKKAMQAHQEQQEQPPAIVSMEPSELTDDSGALLLAPVPVVGPSVAP